MAPRRVQHSVNAPLGDGADLCCSDREVVARHAKRSTVEVAAGLDPAIGRHNRVVDRRPHLVFSDPSGERHRVAGRPVDLRGTAQRVRILDSRIVVAMGSDNRRVGKHRSHVGCGDRLAGMRSHLNYVGCEGPVSAKQPFHTHCGNDVCRVEQHFEIGESQHQHPKDPVCSVDER